MFFCSKILIVSEIEFSGATSPLRNLELIITPASVWGLSITLKVSCSLNGLTTVLISRLYFLAKSKSLWSCPGHPKTAPKP